MEATVPKADYDKLRGEFNALKHRLEQLIKLVHGAKSERFSPVALAGQMSMFAAEGDQGESKDTLAKERITYERRQRKAHPGRAALPGHLPVRQVTILPKEDVTGMKRIGEEITRKLD